MYTGTPKGGTHIQSVQAKGMRIESRQKKKKESLKLKKMENTASLIFASLEYSLPHVLIFNCYLAPRNC